MSGQAIRTRYYGPTNYTGSCIRAKAEAGSIRVPYDHALNIEDNHKVACQVLLDKLAWTWAATPHYGVFGGDFYWTLS